MILFEKALKIVMDSVRELGVERVGIEQALNRILAQDVISEMDMPAEEKTFRMNWI